MKILTDRQRQILDFIQQRQDTDGMAPSIREIAAHFRFRSPNAVTAHLAALRNKGALRRIPRRARSLQVINPYAPRNRPRSPVVTIPIYGAITAGLPRDATQETEGCLLIDVNTLGIKPTARTFGLKVQGDSMVGKHIMDGDVVVIEHGVQPRPGDVVAALIDGQVTLKTFFLFRGKPHLRAENPKYQDLIPQEELQIQGVMVALIRKRTSS
jgi:repressor LexA